MPKVQYINPDEVRKPDMLEFTPIPINQYNKTVEPFDRTGSRSRGNGLHIRCRRFYFRFAPQPRRNPGQRVIGHRQTQRRATD